MPTFAESAAARDAKWTVIFTIEGCGDYSGLFKFCTQVPDYAVGDSHYRPWLMEWPHIVDEQLDDFGGIPDSGEFSCTILDYENTLTSEWRIEADPVTFLSGDHAAGATTLTLDAYSSFTAGSSVCWVGNEIYRIASGAGPFTVDPGALDSDTFQHSDGDPVYAYQSYLHQRRLRVYIAPIDAADSSQEVEFGVYAIDEIGLTDDLCGWLIRAKSQAKWLSRVMMRRPAQAYDITGSVAGDNTIPATLTVESFTAGYPRQAQTWDNGPAFYVKINDEVAIVSALSSYNSLRLRHRAQLGTVQGEIKAGDRATVIYAADPNTPPGETDTPSFFRWSAGPTPATTEAGAWTPSSHWIDLILNLATSSADPADGLRFANRNADYGAWDCLPHGVGIGTPHSLIDIGAAVGVRALYPDQRFDNFYVPPEPVEFGEFISQRFLKLLGGRLSISGGVAKISLPRFPSAGDSALVIGPAESLKKMVAKRAYAYDISAPGLDKSKTARAVSISFSNGETVLLTASNYGRSTKESQGYYATEEPPKKIDANFVSADVAGIEFITEALRHHFVRNLQPRWDFNIKVDFSQYAAAVGDLLSFEHYDMPDLATGSRGWAAMTLELLRRVARVTPEAGAVLDWGVKAYGSNVRVGRVAPAARIVSVSDAGGTPDVTVTANRYTHTDGDDAGFPVTDAAAFAVNDVVRLRNRNGTSAGGTTQVITAIAGNVITLDGNFGGTLTNGTGNAGLVLRYATRTNAIAQQYNRFVFFADATSMTVGASTQSPWRYA